MAEAIEEARKAYQQGEVPVGAILIRKGHVIGRGHNLVEQLGDPTAHAEILAIRESSKRTGYKILFDSTLFVTVEPCSMCAGAILLSRIEKLVFGVEDRKSGACGSLFNILQDKRLNHQVEVEGGVLKKECKELMQSFFKNLRGR